jgi:transposase
MEAMQARLDHMPTAMRIRRRTVEHVFGTLKDRMGRSHFKMRRLENVETEIGLHILAYNIKRAIALIGVPRLMAAIPA